MSNTEKFHGEADMNAAREDRLGDRIGSIGDPDPFRGVVPNKWGDADVLPGAHQRIIGRAAAAAARSTLAGQTIGSRPGDTTLPAERPSGNR